MSHSLGIVIESLVAVLLMLTIGYCMLLNKRLKRLKADEHSLKATIAELITATEIAERAIGGLKHTVRDVNENLGSQLDGGDADVGASEEACSPKATASFAGCPRSRSRRGPRRRPNPQHRQHPRSRPPRRLPRRLKHSPNAEGPVASPHEVVSRHPCHSGRAGRDLRPCRAEDRRPRDRWRIRVRLSGQPAGQAVLGAG